MFKTVIAYLVFLAALLSSNDSFGQWVPATVGGGVPATKAQMQTGTDNTGALAVTPGNLKQSKSTVMAWINATNNGATCTTTASFNVTSCTRIGVGLVNITFSTAFADTTYVGLCGSNNAQAINVSFSASSTTVATAFVTNISGVATDALPFNCAFIGAQ